MSFGARIRPLRLSRFCSHQWCRCSQARSVAYLQGGESHHDGHARRASVEERAVASASAAVGPGLSEAEETAARAAALTAHSMDAVPRDSKPSTKSVDPRLLHPSRSDRQRSSKEASGDASGWFAMGIYRNKHLTNHGTLWRSAWQFGAAFIFTIGDRFGIAPGAIADTSLAWKRIPAFRFADFQSLEDVCQDTALVAVEIGGTPLEVFEHPPRAVYLLGSEDQGLPASVVARCTHHVELPTVREASMNVATCGAIVMYDRELKRRLSANTVTGEYQKRWCESRRGKNVVGNVGESSERHWSASRRRGLARSAQHLEQTGNSALHQVRGIIEDRSDYFVSFAAPPQIVVPAVSGNQKSFFLQGLLDEEPFRAALVAHSALETSDTTLIQFLPLLLHVRCKDIQASHRLIKATEGLADTSISSVDMAKLVVRIVGNGRAVECPMVTVDERSVTELLSMMLSRLERASEELRLLRARLDRATF